MTNPQPAESIEQRPGDPEPEPVGDPVCGCGAADAEWTVDPYAQDIEGKSLWSWWCRACYQQACDDI